VTIQQTLAISANHRLTIDVPKKVSAGKAVIAYGPGSAQDFPGGRRKIPGDPVALVQETAKRAERERAGPAYRAEIAEIRRKCREGGPVLGGMEFQRRARDEWPD
jgi:hypothetical protein